MIAAEQGGALDNALESVIAPAALQRLLAYPWPGNLRQLHAVIRYSCAVMNGARIELRDLPEELMQFDAAPLAQVHPIGRAVPAHGHAPHPGRSALSPAPDDGLLAAFSGDPYRDERIRVIAALNGSRWNISAASRQLGMCRASLYRKLRQLDIPHVRDQAMPAYAAA